MTRTEVTALSLRLAAIYVGLDAFLLLPGLTFWLRRPANDDMTGYSIGLALSVVLLAIFAVLLFQFAPVIAGRMSGGSEPMHVEDRHEVGALAFRLAGIVLLDRALVSIWNLVGHARGAPASGFWADLVVTLLLTVAGTWLFVSGRSLAGRLFGGSRAEGTERPGDTLQVVAFSVIGMWILAEALPGVVILVTALIQRHLFAPDEFDNPPLFGFGHDWPDALASVSRVVLGLVLLLGGSSLSRFWHWIRTAGLARPRPLGQ